MSGVWLLLQLVFGFAVVLAPGALVARTIGVRSASATLAWALALVFAALAVTFLVGGSLTLTLVLVLAGGAAALAVGIYRQQPGRLVSNPLKAPHRGAVTGIGAILGLLLWHVAGHVGGDGFFHLARIQKLLAFGDLSLSSANEFPDGGLHPGYAFPLWHGFLALVAKTSGAEPVDVVLHAPTVLAPLLVLVVYEAGWALFRRPVPAAASVAAGVAIAAMAPSHGGALTALALPATASRQLLVPAALALALEALRRPTTATLATAGAGSLVLAAVHPTYAVFLWIPFTGFLAVRWLWERRDAREGGLALAALVVPAGLFLAWLLPVVADTASVAPDASERTRAFDQYAGQLTGTADRFSVVPELFGRTGAVAVAALLLIPLAGLASRRRWAAYVVGGSLAVFVLCLVPWVFTPFSDVVSLSQSRRLAGFLPLAFALAGGMGVLARLLGRRGRPARARHRDRAPARLPRRLRLRPRPRRPGLGNLDRRPRHGRRSRSRVPPQAPARAHRSPRLGARPAPDVRPRPDPLDAVGRAAPQPADGQPRRGGARGGPCRRDRLRNAGVELPPRCPRADPGVRQPARTRGRHGREPAAGARGGVPPLRPDRRPRDPARVRRDLASRRPRPIPRRSVPTCRSSTATSGGSSTGSEARLGTRVRSPP